MAIATAYDSIEAYVRGVRPGRRMTPSDHSQNTDPRAWLWEARLEKSCQPFTRTTLRCIIWSLSRRRNFFADLTDRVIRDALSEADLESISERITNSTQVEDDDMIEAACREVLKAL